MMDRFQKVSLDGNKMTINREGRIEHHEFSSPEEAKSRLDIIEEAFSWIGTPFVDCGATKGPNGAIDCAMLLCSCYVSTGRLAAFDPRPYPPRWHVHKDEERFINWIERLGGRQVDKPQIADIVVYKFGRCYSHGAIVVNSREIVHAYAPADMCMLTDIDEPVLAFKSKSNKDLPRECRYYNVWGN